MFSVPGHTSKYLNDHHNPRQSGRIGYRIVDEETEGRLVVAPGIADLDRFVCEQLIDSDVAIVDGTFWSDDELQRSLTGNSLQTACSMGHIPVSGPAGSLVTLKGLSLKRCIYAHINNTNPMLSENSDEFAAVGEAGIEVGVDGLEFTL